MRFSSVKYFMSDAFKSIWRNRTISLASVATVAATLFIFGVFLFYGIFRKKERGNLKNLAQTDF